MKESAAETSAMIIDLNKSPRGSVLESMSPSPAPCIPVPVERRNELVVVRHKMGVS